MRGGSAAARIQIMAFSPLATGATVVILPDDPKLRDSSARRRSITQRNRLCYSKSQGAAQGRSVTKNHQHHLLYATGKTVIGS